MARLLSFLVGSAMLISLATTSARAADEKEDPKDPVYDGKKASEWGKLLEADSSARQRALAVEALNKLWTDKQHPEAVFYIGRALRLDKSAAVRTRAAIALGGLRDVDVAYFLSDKGKGFGVNDLVDAIGKEKESRVKKEIAKAIGRFPAVAKLAVVQLTEALKDPEAGTRAAIADAIAITGSTGKSAAAGLAPLLTDEDKAVRKSVVMALGRITPDGSSAVAEVMAKMLGTEKDVDMRVELVTSIGLLGEKSSTVVTSLGMLLTDPSDELRRRATRTLGACGTAAQPVADALLKVARTDKLKDIRVDAVNAFGDALGPTELKSRMKDLVSLLMDPDYEVRLAVVEEIGSLGNDLLEDKETLKALRVRQSDAHKKVRDAAVLALQKIEKKPEPKKEP